MRFYVKAVLARSSCSPLVIPNVKHMKNQRYLIVWLIVSIAISACSRNVDENTLGERLSKTDNVEEMWQLAAELKSRGKRGIPGLLCALSSVSEQSRWSVVDYGRIEVCTKTLHELATAGVYIEEELPVLIRTIELQIYMPDTFVTADILRIITDVDPGYSKEFVESYSGSETDERARREKIEKWKQWWRDNRGESQGA